MAGSVDYITAPEAARIFGYNRRYVAEMCRKGRFKTAQKKPGRFKLEWLVDRHELEQYSNRGPYSRKIIVRTIDLWGGDE